MAVEFDETVLGKQLNNKIRAAAVLIGLCFLFVFFRLYYLQILKGSTYLEQSVNNRLRITTIAAPRGMICAENGDVLVTNKPSFDLQIIPQDTPNIRATLTTLASLLNMPRDALQKRYDMQRGRPPFEPVTLKKDLSWDNMSLVLAKKPELQGIAIGVVPTRRYADGIKAPHVFGFVGEIDRAELERLAMDGYLMGESIGKFGLEKWCERYLRGKRGGLQSEVDAYGNRTKILASIEPVAGCNLRISIVPRVQRVAEALLAERSGAIVALATDSGAVIAMASSPGFDPLLFARGIDRRTWQRLTSDPLHPLLNRAIQTQQPPGSVFKVITAIAALEEKIIDPSFTVFCPGYLNLGSRTFNCWKKHGHGYMNLHDALVQSCDTYFYTLGMRLGVDAIHKYATLLGLGRKTGIELDGEKPGLIPSQEWKKKRFGYPWQKGETLNTTIGQGFVLVTPLQVATMMAAIANQTHVPQPHIVLSVECPAGPSPALSAPTSRPFGLAPATLAVVKKSLAGVVNEPAGTGSKARIAGVTVAGKTGTAQVVSRKAYKERTGKIPRQYEDHAWFAAFAPAEHPKIAVAVFCEHGGHGASAAAPLARDIIAAYLGADQPPGSASAVSDNATETDEQD